MSWTIQSRWRGDREWSMGGEWEDWSGHQAYDLLEKAVEVLVRTASKPSTLARWQWQIVNKDTGEVIPEELFG